LPLLGFDNYLTMAKIIFSERITIRIGSKYYSEIFYYHYLCRFNKKKAGVKQ